MAGKQKGGLFIIALVEFDTAITKDAYEKLKELYDFGEVTDRVFKDYNDNLLPLPKNEYFEDEVEKVQDDAGHYYVLKTDNNKTIESYNIQKRAKGEWVGITNTKHVVELEELYKTYRKVQVKILEVAKI